MATNDKYDRQLRLWGPHGQRAIGTGKCIMLGTSSAGTETLKNLVLPGFGNITIVDDKRVEQRDCGNDFFVTADQIGQPKAQVVCDLMLEMNPDDVAGQAVDMAVSEYIGSQADTIRAAQLIIACDVDDATALSLSDICAPLNTPLILLRQYGMIGYLRICKPLNCIIEPKIAQVKFKDLRVSQPWPELQQFADEFDLSSLEEIKFIHVPYAIVLIKACQKWREEHEGQMPATFAQKQEFKAMIKSMNRFVVAENFDEAMNAYAECFKKDEVLPDNIQRVFSEYQNELTTSNEAFWLMARALKQFVESEGRLPVQGTIPDMISMPDYYLKLQRLYLTKSAEDIAKLRALVDQYVAASNGQAQPVDQKVLELFVRNCLQIEVLRMNTVRQELEQPDWSADIADEMMCDPDAPCPRWLIAMKAFEKAAAKSANPAAFSDDQNNQEADLAAMKLEAKAMTDAMEQESEIDERYLKELLRYGRSKLHCVSSFLGGVASQEACKLVMSQYMPLNHTFVYDGINGTGQVFNL